MKVQDGQTFLSLYLDPGVVEIADGAHCDEDRVVEWKGKSRDLGQVPTPAAIADLMAEWVMSAKPKAVLDPAAGLGALLAACGRLDPGVNLVGVELDAPTMQAAKKTAPPRTKLVLADYLFSEAGQFQGIIANPPYVKSQRLGYTEAQWQYFDERFGTRMDRLTNLYALFLLKIWDDLALGGRAAVLLPAEFLNANFGREIKERLLSDMRPQGIVVFAPELNLFPDALTTSALVFLERSKSCDQPIWAIKANSVEEAASFVKGLLGKTSSEFRSAAHDLGLLRPEQKWLNALMDDNATDHAAHLDRTIGDYFRCRRGIATGANDYFCLSASLIKENGLSDNHVTPCVTKATDAKGLVFTEGSLAKLAEADRRVFLLNPKVDGAELNNYLREGERLGIPERHLPSHRPVWFQPENREPADVWVAVFSRETVKFILNTSGAKNLTCFHGLYPLKGNERLAPLLVLFLNSSWGKIAFSKVNRFYGDGLNKLEPKDVEAMPCPPLPCQSEIESAALVQRLLEVEQLSEPERRANLDQMVLELLGLPPFAEVGEEAMAAAPAERHLHPAKIRRPQARQKRRAVPVP